jgi:hypothetical protein
MNPEGEVDPLRFPEMERVVHFLPCHQSGFWLTFTIFCNILKIRMLLIGLNPHGRPGGDRFATV